MRAGERRGAVSGGLETHTCALNDGRRGQVLGEQRLRQLGDGTTTDRDTPVDVIGLASGVTASLAGGGHTCALTTSGRGQVLGVQRLGQLGDGTTTDRYTPVDVIGLASGVAQSPPAAITPVR